MLKLCCCTILSVFMVFAPESNAKGTENPADDAKGSTEKIFINGNLFTTLIYGNTDLYGDIPRPFLYPIIGPTGSAMTRSYPMEQGVEGEASDHPHHRSLWFAHGAVNGVDFWTQGKGKGSIRATNIELRDLMRNDNTQTSGAHIQELAYQEEWAGPSDNLLLRSQSNLTFSHQNDARFIDCHYQLTPAGLETITFGDTKEGTMAIRLHPALRLKGKVASGKAINSEGVTGKGIWGKRAKWVAYWGVIDGKTCGVAIFDHPRNLRHPTWWHARDYGLVAANPFGVSDFENLKPRGKGDFTLKAGETLELRYRFVFFAGTAEDADIAGKYERWVKETTPDDEEEDAEKEEDPGGAPG